MRTGALCLGLLLLAALGGCANTGGPDIRPQTAGRVNLKRYQSTWYEQARLPMYFQRNCAQSQATYQLKADGSLDVLNRCRTQAGQWEQAHGTATAQVAGKTDKLWVRFDNAFSWLFPGLAKGDYWVLYVSDDYQLAVVGDPTRKYLWLLSRRPTVPDAIAQLLMAKARQQGYDTRRLIWRAADSSIGQ
ncbi:lipocalin family protein [Pseudomonas typographi]|uniref:lipocalin family protein n=1 Tax=Pseudomonas typographi TaxID=2715964 RepID=UPI001686725C|nr:lipocalin family protein [Pseudomonas typographi]MBD1587668.1 lipocalin family protein [Pseudomonas typographi]